MPIGEDELGDGRALGRHLRPDDPTGRLLAASQNRTVLAVLGHMRAQLDAGVTTVRDPGGPYGLSIDLVAPSRSAAAPPTAVSAGASVSA